MKMTFEEFTNKVGIKPAKIGAKVDEKGDAIVSLEGRCIELLSLSMNIAENVMKNTHTDVDDYCNVLKIGIKNNFHVPDSEKSKEHSRAISREQFIDVYKQVLNDVLDDKNIDVEEKILASLLVTKYVNQMCEKLFGEGLKNE